ncbi:MAG: 2-oxo acid dehydrogenase subunit E2 [Dehalococcoidia bacterium]|nr:2-oxo acid dehydrogenase subunit E2 [Dehalococcoidia bacterium]
MSQDFTLPDLGEGIAEADILTVLVHEGDTIAVDQPLVTIETEKATIDVPSGVAGRVTKVHVAPGQTVRPGQPLITFEDASIAPTPAPASAAPPPEPPRNEAPAPPSPAPTPEPAEAPVPTRPQPEVAPVEATTAELALERPPGEAAAAPPPPPAASEPPAPPRETAPPAAPVEAATADGVPVFAAPSVRQFARQIGVDIRQVRGSGPGGRIDEEDVKRHARSRPAAEEPSTAAAPASAAPPIAGQAAGHQAPPLPDFSQFGPVDREPLSRFRRTVARNMTTSWEQIPYVTLFQTTDITELEDMRRRYRERAREAGGNLTISVVLLKIVAAALKANPHFNSSLDVETNELILKRYYDIGMAVDTERGLAVPVIRGVDDKNIIELAVEMAGIAERARENKLTLEEMRGATFTISNLGSLGTGHFTPLVNWPEVAILGVGRAEQTPVWTDGQWQPRLQLPLSLSIDHRVIDGADGARFLNWIADAIREPLIVAMEG